MAAHFEGRRVLISNAKVMGDFLALLEASGAFASRVAASSNQSGIP